MRLASRDRPIPTTAGHCFHIPQARAAFLPPCPRETRARKPAITDSEMPSALRPGAVNAICSAVLGGGFMRHRGGDRGGAQPGARRGRLFHPQEFVTCALHPAVAEAHQTLHIRVIDFVFIGGRPIRGPPDRS